MSINTLLGNIAVNAKTTRTWSLDDIFSSIEMDENKMRKDPVDGLALSVLQRKNRAFGSSSLTVTEHEHKIAAQIRDYYSKKIVVLNLKGEKLSKFRKDLSIYLANGYTDEYPEKYMGMIYKLPEFYYYDLEIDELRQIANCENLQTFIGVKKLKLERKLYRSVSSGSDYQFWLTDEDNHLYSLSIDKHNPLLSMFESLVEYPEFNISAKFLKAVKDDLQFYKIVNPRLLILRD